MSCQGSDDDTGKVDPKQEISSVRKTRAARKRKVTIYFKKLKELHEESKLTSSFCKAQIKEIEKEVAEIKENDSQINNIMDTYDLDSSETKFYNNELDSQAEYNIQVGMDIDFYEDYLNKSSGTSGSVSAEKVLEIVSKLNMSDGKPPPLECGIFTGKEKDKFAFTTFLNQFNNVIGSRKNLTDSAKLTYLLGYLRDYALKIVKHLTITDCNYLIAIQMLKNEFLDVQFIVDETFKNILNASPNMEFDAEYTSVKMYINEIKAYLYELKYQKIDLLEKDTAGHRLISHIVFSKLPLEVKREMVHKVSDNYPTITDIFDNYNEVIKTLTKTTSVRPKIVSKPIMKPFNKPFGKPFIKPVAGYNDSTSKFKIKEGKSTMENFKTVNTVKTVDTKVNKLICKLCGAEGHTLGKCHSYVNHTDKIIRLRDLGLCSRCAGSGHSENECYGKQNKLRFECLVCKKKEHITPLCPLKYPQSNPKTNVSLCYAQKSIDSSQILPTMTLLIKNGKKMKKVRCLIDSGSQRSYISETVAKDLCSDINMIHSLECEVHTYIGEETKEFKQMSSGIYVNNRLVFVPLLVDRTLNINLEIPGMNQIIRKFKNNNLPLLDEAFLTDSNYENINIDMLVGIDIIQFMVPGTYVKQLGGTCFLLNGRLAPIGNILNFLDKDESKAVMSSLTRNSDLSLNNKTKTMVNLVMDPLKSYFNPLENILEDSEVDNGLEYLFSLESMGIKNDDKELASYDKDQIDKFKAGIIFKDGHYHVELPWLPEKINKVPSNHVVALKVLDKTMNHLRKIGLTEKYQEVFDKQLADGIIEEIIVHPSDYNNHVWIPHRPVIKTEEQVTTKIRPVFNCSLKTNKDLPSLNEAAYTGIDLMGSILKLLFYFRTNKYVMVSDVKQAFLMVKLKKVEDKNKFCFFWRRGDTLVAYRYKSIVFGYTSSPFILNYVMKHHAEQYPDDECTEILSDNFYVDNLFATGNHPGVMLSIYNQAYDRMKEGGFTLRSWNSNSIELREQMKTDDRLVEHTCDDEKVLGYRFNVNNDTLKLAHCNLDSEANTKRKILSQTSKLFDPLNLVLPVTIRGKILMRKIWKLDVGWDDELPKDICNEMKNICKDFEMLSELKFSRQAVNEQNSYGLHIFCDSSVEAYGFTAYALDQNNQSSFLFAKSKLAPLSKHNEHSVPTLELLGVILALKCLPTILEAYSNIQFQFININVDAQVVLNWLLTKETKVKSKFVRNRVLEADSLKTEIFSKFKIPIVHHYVNTVENPADMITRGLTYSLFLKKLKFWLEGPEWLSNNFENWPQFPLLSISPDHKKRVSTTCTIQVNKVNTGIVNINNFSNFEKLLKTTGYFFKLVSKIKGYDPKIKSIEYWVKIAQSEYFAKEISFLKESANNLNNKNKVPPLVLNLNLFLDNNGILRSRGRISKCLYFNFDIHNPILLPKEHRFTSLLIMYCHLKVQHLGVGTTLNYLRELGYWIPKGRSAVKTELSSCITCKKYNALAFKYPKFTDMPKHHMNLVKPFQHVGIDYTGHFWVIDEVSGKNTKMFILVFTCLNIRAVHFELLPDMSTKNFLLAFQRFSNIYAIPQYLYSDNAKQFLKGGCMLENSLKSKEVQAELENCNIKHVKIPLYSAWVGSAWERLIRVLKNCLYKTIGRSKLTYFELLTTLSNIQLAINSRPLTYRSSTERLEFITPNSFIKLHGNSSLILRGDDNEIWVDDTNQPSLERTVEIQEEIIENFKKLWYESYLLSLREHSRNLYQSRWENRIKVGDIVLIKAFNKPRPFWIMGKVLELVVGFDGNVRSVKLKQANGSIEYHSICNLYPLELSVTHAIRDNKINSGNNNAESNNQGNSDTVQIDSNRSVRPKRKATERFNRMLRDNLDDL